MIVTDSRWWLDPTQAVAPVTVLDRRDIERGGDNSIGDVLQALPMTTGSPLNTNGNAPGSAEPRGRGAAGDGSARISLHDLPTLVLLNGRRLPSSGLGADASVDLNTLPMSFIERVEVLASGASAAFGADAIGGVVNIVTRRSKPARAHWNAHDHRTRRWRDRHGSGGDRRRAAGRGVEPGPRLRRAGRRHDGSAQLLLTSADHRG